MKNQLVDLSHLIENGMPGFRLRNEDGSFTHFTAQIRPFLTHEQSRPKYQGKASFEITEITLQTSIGTYLDSPFHRYPQGRDISQIGLDETILDGVAIDVTGKGAFEPVGLDVIPGRMDLKGRAVLFNFGWDRFWGDEAYFAYPFLSRRVIDFLIEKGVRLVGVDTINIDDSHDPERPAHTRFLSSEILIVENLCNLAMLVGREFTFFAVPLKVKGAAAMPLRAFARLENA
jgi:arylformamidase